MWSGFGVGDARHKGGEGGIYMGLRRLQNMTSQSLVNKFNTCKDPRAQVWRLSHTRGDSPPPIWRFTRDKGGRWLGLDEKNLDIC